MEGALTVLEWVQRVAFTGLALISLGLYARHRSAPPAWAAAAFGSLAAIVVVAWIAGEDTEDLPLWFVKLLIVAILAFPYLLFRFMAAFVRPPRWAEGAGAALTAALVVWTLALTDFPAQGEPQSPGIRAYVLAVLVQWTFLSAWVSIRLWTAGSRQPTLPRWRLRMLAAAAFGLNVSIVVSGAAGSEPSPAMEVGQAALGLVSALFFYLGLQPPGFLRALWRRPEEEALRDASIGVSAATTAGEVAEALLPHIAPLFGGSGALLVREDGRIAGTHGLALEEIAAIAGELEEETEERGARVRPGLMTLPLRRGALAVKASPYSPLFGSEETRLLESTGAFVDLALDRAGLFESERLARAEVERTNAELEAFLYSVSHDLKSPLVALSGYLGYLEEDFGGDLGEEGQGYLSRMSVNVRYMESLIHGLLELSRVGRFETEPDAVDAGDLVADVASEIERAHPNVTVDAGPLPVLWMNPVRARQLFTNLLENAVKHGGRPDLKIRVGTERAEDGSVELSVADDGRGIPADYREKVFGVFEHLEGPGADGTGIGLSICKKIVEQLGGRIRVADNEPGADFRIHLPASAVAGRRTEAAP